MELTGTDPAGDVAEGRDNTGAAAVFKDAPYQPLQIWQEAQKRIDAANQKLEAQNATRQANLLKNNSEALKDIETKGAFDNDIANYFRPGMNAYLQQYGNLHAKGNDPGDPNNLSHYTMQSIRNSLEGTVKMSVLQNAEYQKQLELYENDKDDKLNHDEGIVNLNNWRNLSPDERAKTPIPVPLVNYDLEGALTKGLSDVKPATNTTKSLSADGNYIYDNSKEAHTPEQIIQLTDRYFNLPQAKKELDKRFSKEPKDIQESYIDDNSFNSYKNSPSYQPSYARQNDLSPAVLAQQWDNMGVLEKVPYGSDFNHYKDVMAQTNKSLQDQADKAYFNGLSTEQRGQFANKWRYLKDKLVNLDAGKEVSGTTAGPLYEQTYGSGAKEDKASADYLGDKISKLIVNYPTIDAGPTGDGKATPNDKFPVDIHSTFMKTPEQYVGFKGESLGKLTYTLPSVPGAVDVKTGQPTIKTPAKPVEYENRILGATKVGDQLYLQTTESDLNPKKYPNGIPVKDPISEVLRPMVMNSKDGGKVWEQLSETFAKKGIDLKAGNVGKKEAEKFLNMKKNKSKLSAQTETPIYDQDQ